VLDRIKEIVQVTLVKVIEVIEEITCIKTIETINSMPDPTPKGSEGIAFKQASAGAGAWVSPTGFEDPDSVWTYETNAYDESTGTGAVVTPPPLDWSKFLHLTHSAITSNNLRIYITYTTIQFSQIDIDVYKDGTWVHVYEGSPQDGWYEYTFSEGSVTKVRIRVYGKSGADVDQSIKEFDFWQVPSTGGEMIAVSEYALLNRVFDIDEVAYDWNADGTLNTKTYKKSAGTVLTLTYTWNADGTLQKVVRT
jgi:hypothetical protein